MRLYRDRREAGVLLSELLRARPVGKDPLVLALPRGGVPVGYEVARALGAPLDVFVVRKLGMPGYEELALGAVASGGIRVINHDVVEVLGVGEQELDRLAAGLEVELLGRERRYRGDLRPLAVTGRSLILVDDGIATGATMRAAIVALRLKRPARITVAVPVAARDTCEEIEAEVDDLVCGLQPEPFHAVGLWYEDFSQVSDEDVRALIERSRSERELRAHA